MLKLRLVGWSTDDVAYRILNWLLRDITKSAAAVVGCVNPLKQPGMTITRNGDVITIGCDVTSRGASSYDESVWQMTCVQNRWIGSYGNCSDGNFSSLHSCSIAFTHCAIFLCSLFFVHTMIIIIIIIIIIITIPSSSSSPSSSPSQPW